MRAIASLFAMAIGSELVVDSRFVSTRFQVPPGFDDAPNEQRIAFVQELWDRIAAHPNQVPLPPEHQRILEERLAAYRADPQPGRAWSEVRDELLAKIRTT